MDYLIDENRVIKLVGKLDFARVVGTEGEERGFQVLRQELTAGGIPAWFEEFSSTWVEVAEAHLQVEEADWPLVPLVPPVFNTPWMPIPEEVDMEGVLVDSLGSYPGDGPAILLRTPPDRAPPCVPGAAAQVFVGEPEVGLVAYFLAEVGRQDRVVPSASIASEAEPDLRQRLGRPARLQWTSREGKKTLRNLVAELRGRERHEEIIAVGAHLDSFPGTVGASDNASGCARLVEFARWFVTHPPARTLRFLWFTGEELDRRGSRAYVRAHEGDEDRLCLFINVDGGVSSEHQRFPVDTEDPRALAETVSASLDAVFPAVGPRPFRCLDHCPDSSDAGPFHEAGIPAMLAPGGGKRKQPGPHPHLPTDTVDRLDRENVRTATLVGLAFLDAAQRHGLTPVANRPGRRER